MSTFNENNQPKNRRNKAFKTLLWESMREQSSIGLNPNSTREEAEKAFIKHCCKVAFDSDDKNSGMILKEFLSKSFPGLKPTLEKIEFNFPEDGTPVDKTMAVITAISQGKLPADIGQIVIGIIKDSVVIEEGTDLKARIEELEKAMGIG